MNQIILQTQDSQLSMFIAVLLPKVIIRKGTTIIVNVDTLLCVCVNIAEGLVVVLTEIAL